MENSALVELSDSELNSRIDKTVSKERITAMVKKMNTVEEKISHLQKVTDRWGTASAVIKGIGVSLTFILTLVMSVLNSLPSGRIDEVTLKVLTVIMSSLVTLTAVSSEGSVLGYTYRNQQKFQKQLAALQKKYNRCYLYYEAARADKVITNEELNGFYRIFENDEEITKGVV